MTTKLAEAGGPAPRKWGSFNWEDPMALDGLLTEEERMVQETARQYAQDKLMPRIVDAYNEEREDLDLIPEMGELGLLENGEARVAFVNRLNLLTFEEYDKYAPTLAPLAADVLTLETGADVWKHVKERIDSTNVEWMRERLDCVVLAYVWPRLDAAVTRDLKHLTKVPFSCHAATGRVAAAMGAERKSIFGFKPARQAPSLREWDQQVMDAAVARFRVGDAPTDASADAQAGKRKRSGLATCAEDQGSKRMARPHHAAVVGGD